MGVEKDRPAPGRRYVEPGGLSARERARGQGSQPRTAQMPVIRLPRAAGPIVPTEDSDAAPLAAS